MINPSLKDLSLLLEELKEIAKKRGIKSYESMSEDSLLIALMSSKPVKKSEKNFDDTKPKIHFSRPRIEKIKKEFNESSPTFSKSKINKITRTLYKTRKRKESFCTKHKKIERNLIELEENLFMPTKYYDYADYDYERNKRCKRCI